jgi:hypothetical protein
MNVSRTTAGVYFTLATAGLVGTWFFNFSYTGSDYLSDWFANAASSSAAVDIIAVLVVSLVLYSTEGRRVGLPLWFLILLVPLSIVGAVACALPIFLGVRELKLAKTPSADTPAVGP